MQVAICDDEPQELEYIKSLVNRYAPPDVTTCCFSSAEDLLAATQTNFFPLIYLDIEMEYTNGFDAAQELMANEKKPLIVFVTKTADYSIRGYDVAFHYLLKPIDEKKFQEVLDRVLRTVLPQHLQFSVGGVTYPILLHEILYFESQSYQLHIHTSQQVFTIRLGMKDIEQEFGKAGFFRVHASYIINLFHVRCFSKTEVMLDSGDHIPISRNRKKAFDEAFTIFMRRFS